MDAATFTTVRLLAGACVLAAIVRARGGRRRRPPAAGARLVGPARRCSRTRRRSRSHTCESGGDRRAAAVRRRADHDDRVGTPDGRTTAGGPGRHRRRRRGPGMADVAVGAPAQSDRQRADGRRRVRVGRLFDRRQEGDERAGRERAQLRLGGPARAAAEPAAAGSVGRGRREGRFCSPADVRRHALGVGDAIWYRALRGLTATQAGIVQLSVPVIAAAGAVVFLNEAVNPRLAIWGAAVIGGLALVLWIGSRGVDCAAMNDHGRGRREFLAGMVGRRGALYGWRLGRRARRPRPTGRRRRAGTTSHRRRI